MLEYKNQLRLQASLRKGSVNEPDLNPKPGYESELDKEIIRLAGKHLKGRNLNAFFWAYHCVNSWEAIQMKFFNHLNCELEVGTIQRYARNAANTILGRI
jgi:hypothetical protein